MSNPHVLLETNLGKILIELFPDKAPQTVANFLGYVDLDHQDDADGGYGYAVFGRVVEGADVIKKINWRVTKAIDDFPELPKDEVFIAKACRFE